MYFNEYCIKFEKGFNNYLNNPSSWNYDQNNRPTYPSDFNNPKVREFQRKILYQLQGGRDILTGERMIDIYRRVNPDNLNDINNLKDEQILDYVYAWTIRHHYKIISDPSNNKVDCRIQSLALIILPHHTELHFTNDQNFIQTYGKNKEELINEALNSLLNGEAPKHWNQKYQMEFYGENQNNENVEGITYLF
jgi:hypothetical protein